MHTGTKQESNTHPHMRQSGDPLKSLLRNIAESGERIPEQEQEQIPRDFAKNIDHYLYGAPKERE
ncbi:MAG TPA: hypothetical protein VG537_00620 [Candidatus Kapabacteria bacterium]|nr:hypothetical protein [Candidatus Kapabacteria bacterium]